MTEASRKPVEAGEINLTGDSMPTEKTAQKRGKMPFMSMDGRRNIQAVYRVVYDLHKRHSPPVIDDEGASEYWTELGRDVIRTVNESGEDPLIMDLLVAVMKDLEREYKQARKERNT